MALLEDLTPLSRENHVVLFTYEVYKMTSENWKISATYFPWQQKTQNIVMKIGWL